MGTWGISRDLIPRSLGAGSMHRDSIHYVMRQWGRYQGGACTIISLLILGGMFQSPALLPLIISEVFKSEILP